MIFRIISLFSIVLMLVFYSCSPKSSDVVAKFDDQTIGLKEFENAYVNNVGSLQQAEKDSLSKLENYLNLYVDFRMKLRDAFVRGFDSDSTLQAEVQNYKNEIGRTYIIDKKLINPAINELYNRRKWEYRVSHIMIVPDSSGEEHAKELADKILDSLQHGANWDEMAAKYSKDRYTSNNGGDIFYVTAGQLPPSFEDAVYATEPGHIYPKVVKTRYGFHIIKVTDKRPRVPEIRASHILAAFRDSSGKIDSAAAKAKIDSAMQELKNGVDFAKVAEKYSDDPGSKMRGGDLGFFNIRMMVKPFGEAAFNLKKVGDISGIVTTPYGYHIIKLTGIKPEAPFDEQETELKKIYKETRYPEQYAALIDSLRNAFKYHLNDSVMQKISSIGDTIKVGTDSLKFAPIENLPLFTYENKSFLVGQFLKKMNDNAEYKNRTYSPGIVNVAEKAISGDVMMDNAVDSLEKTDPKFAQLMQNYKDGIYIFKLQEEEVWKKVNPDSTNLYNYYLQHKSQYNWPDRVEYKAIFSKKDSVINNFYSLLKQGMNFDSLAKDNPEQKENEYSNQEPQLVDVNSSDVAEKANSLQTVGSFSEPFIINGGYVIVKLLKKDSAHPKTYEEAKMEVSGQYQDMEIKKLENDYIERLKKLYKPEYYYDRLKEAFKTN
jgi:peptidyl-prolyl cis-trans isomerase SurA